MKSPKPVQFWSAIPTPLAASLEVDLPSLEKTVHAAVDDGMNGLFVGGTCGEGPWLPARERHRLVQGAVKAAGGRLKIAAQVSDNSVPRILDNIREAALAGADYVIIAPPATMMNPTPDRITAFYEEAVAKSLLPVGIYDLGARRNFPIPLERLKQIYLLPNVRLVKDSSAAPERRAVALEARHQRPELQLFNGDEFLCLEYLEAGYDGFMFGGAVAVAAQMQRIAAAFQAGRVAEARAVNQEMRAALYGIYGGESISCWLTGLKYYMVRKGLFASTASYLGYPLTDACRAFIEQYTTAEARV
jgi:4-hydroxy-tetrahydrodipicolinate synthase